MTTGSEEDKSAAYRKHVLCNMADALLQPTSPSHSETETEHNDAARGHHDCARQLRVHAKRRLPAHALRRTRRRSHHRLPNQDRLQYRETVDYGQQGVRAPPTFPPNTLPNETIRCIIYVWMWECVMSSALRPEVLATHTKELTTSSKPSTRSRRTSAVRRRSRRRL